jgi:N-acetylglucosamine-6-sulfatase
VRRPGTWSAVTAAVVLAGCASPSAPSSPAASPTPPPPPPNIVVVVTDDLDVPTTGEMHRLAEIMADQGLSFTQAFVAVPICAPSRASIFTGQYGHNHGVLANAHPYGGFTYFRGHESQTIATWLHDAGYRTALVGKYINDFPHEAAAEYIPPGWDEWYSHLNAFEDDKFYNYYVNDNGTVVWHGAEPEDYSTDDVARRAVEIIRESADRSEPLFLYIAPEAPHRPATYAARHGSEFRGASAPRVPSFNEPDISDKPYGIRLRPMTPAEIVWLDTLQEWRLRSMRAVEELTEGVIEALAETGRIQNTFLFFTSDNGLLMGQHRIIANKRNCYEEAIRVPLIVRGPGVQPGATAAIVSLIDLAPTFLELAGAPIPASVDGRSFAPLLRGTPPESWRNEVLVEYYAAALTATLRTPDWAYIENQTNEIELYDIRADPYQVESLHWDADPALLEELHRRLEALLHCRGASCRD